MHPSDLVEQVEDLQAQLLTSRLEEGRTLVTATNNNSLAAEFEAMTSEEVSTLWLYLCFRVLNHSALWQINS